MKSLEALGERRIIEIVRSRLCLMPKMPVPFGDDVSACNLGNGKLAILKTDMLVDKTDVPPGMTLWQAARKAVIMNISDFAAKGVKPLALLVSLGLPKNLDDKDIWEIGDGLNAGAQEYGTYIIGGDTGEASDVIISISVFGTARKGKVMLRSGAKPGDVVAVTGCFGKTASGLRVLLNDLKVSKRIRRVLVESVLLPSARLNEGLALVQSGAVTASIDSSDGLSWSLYEIGRASNVGFLITRVPMAKEVEEFAKLNKLNPFELALHGGEEYELVLTIKPKLLEKAKEAVEKVGGKLNPIGEVTTGEKILLRTNGKEHAVEPRGYEHFKQRKD